MSHNPPDKNGWMPVEAEKPPRNGTPVLIKVHPDDAKDQDAMHGPFRIAADRGFGLVTIPGLWGVRATHWRYLPPLPESTP